MGEQNSEQNTADNTPESTLVLSVRQGSALRDIVVAEPGMQVTVGRSSSNRVVVTDSKCSRHHCEIFQRSSNWIVRDLNSRNGLFVNDHRISDEATLSESDVIQIGSWEIGVSTSTAAVEEAVDDQAGMAVFDRKTATRYDTDVPSEALDSRTDPGLPALYRLARLIGEATSVSSLADGVLQKLLEATSARQGAILLSRDTNAEAARDFELVAASVRGDSASQMQVSAYLTQTVLESGEALVARDIPGNTALSQRESIEELEAKSALCAPIRLNGTLIGLIHLYSDDLVRPLNSEALEFALAVADQIAVAVANLRQRESLVDGLSRASSENRDLRGRLEIESELVGESEGMHQLRQKIARIAPSDATVLIRGESGVGKELVARAIHFNSRRTDGPFVCVNCAALTETLLESELFGHERGAFTGATQRKPGKFEQADGGTLFLDEIGEMSPEVQTKFLRVLEGHPFERVGGAQQIEADVRIVTATNRNLEEAVQSGAFRNDLYYRLQVIELHVSPLRERPKDILDIAQHFLDRYREQTGSPVRRFNQAALHRLQQYDWPGNVRELKNVIERAVILSDRAELDAGDLHFAAVRPPSVSAAVPAPNPQAQDDSEPQSPPSPTDSWSLLVEEEYSLEMLEQQYIIAALTQMGWNKSATSRMLGIERTTLDRKLKRYGIKRPE